MKTALMNEITGHHNLYHDNASVSKTEVNVTVMWETQEWMLQSCGKDWGEQVSTPGFSNVSRFGQATLHEDLQESNFSLGGAILKHLDSQTVRDSVKQPWLPPTSSYEAFCPCFPEVGRAYRAELAAC